MPKRPFRAGAEASRYLPGLTGTKARGILNALIGDRLRDEHHTIAAEMTFRHRRRPLIPETGEIIKAHGEPSDKVVAFVHDLCMTEQGT